MIQANFSGFACVHVLLTASAGSPLNSSCLNLSEFSCTQLENIIVNLALLYGYRNRHCEHLRGARQSRK
ncbi:hypothetical protein [Rickettsia endosymbiont of Ceutorhynchus obstrictus]|uniref:hypothetical protein n=1 Tax=unclassified Rickettsia TaxID=114295 RepID=UPI00397B7D59